MRNDTDIELASSGMLIRNPQEIDAMVDISALSDIQLVWAAALYTIRNMDPDTNSVFRWSDLSTQPPESFDPEKIMIVDEYNGAWRDTYRTLTITPERAESFRFENIHFDSSEDLDQDITHDANEDVTINWLSGIAKRLREAQDTKVDLKTPRQYNLSTAEEAQQIDQVH